MTLSARSERYNRTSRGDYPTFVDQIEAFPRATLFLSVPLEIHAPRLGSVYSAQGEKEGRRQRVAVRSIERSRQTFTARIDIYSMRTQRLRLGWSWDGLDARLPCQPLTATRFSQTQSFGRHSPTLLALLFPLLPLLLSNGP